MSEKKLSLTELAALAGVPEADARAWSKDVARWAQRGYHLEDAIARQSAIVDRLTFWSHRLDPREIGAAAEREAA